MTTFATYLRPETYLTSREVSPDLFIGYSYPHFAEIGRQLAEALSDYPKLPLRQAPYEEFRRVHTEGYLNALRLMAEDQPVEKRPRFSAECSGYQYCLPGYGYGLGGMYEAIDQMKAGHLDRAFTCSLGGHHAHQDRGHGYCLLNPLAAAARYAQEQGFKKVLMVDWDIHHGDGTQSIFANDTSVHCLSIHSGIDLYMEKASGGKVGTAEAARALGHCNIPIVQKLFDDEFTREHFSKEFYRTADSIPKFEEALNRLPFDPDLVLIFAGFDSHRSDCGDDITDWDNGDFQTLTRLVLNVARNHSCPVLSTQGGGYNLPVTIGAAVAHVQTLATG